MAVATARVAALAAVLLSVLAAGGAGAVTGGPPEQLDVETDATGLGVELGANGDADWTVVYRIRLDDENATAAFEQLRADIRANGSAYVDPFAARMERTARAAENATGRGMAIENVTVGARIESQPQVDYGVVTYRFEWTNFAATEGDTVRAGDAIDQLFLEGDSSLRIGWPEGYTLESASPEPTRTGDREVVWEGRRDFEPGEPRVVVASGPAPGASGFDALGAGAVLAIVLAVGAWLVLRRRGGFPGPAPVGTGPTAEDEAVDDEDDDGEGEGEEGRDGPPPELLSNEERVLALLEENGGRMKQKRVAEQLEWTAAKTSQVVGDLREEGELESFRLGRENVLTLPDVELDAGTESGSE